MRYESQIYSKFLMWTPMIPRAPFTFLPHNYEKTVANPCGKTLDNVDP